MTTDRFPSRVLTVGEVACALGMSKSGVYDLVRHGLIPKVDYWEGFRKVLIPRIWLEKTVPVARIHSR